MSDVRLPPPLSMTSRGIALLLAAAPLLLLGVASQLQPSDSGLGTHQQLGLPPCTLRVLTGIRCPACGMTTSWTHFAQGDWGQSIAVQPGGFLLALYGLAWSVTAGRVGLSGTMATWAAQRRLGIGLVAIGVVVLVDWGRDVWGISSFGG